MLSALATVMARVLEMLVAAGKPVDRSIFAALELVQRTARGEKVPKAALTAAWKHVEAIGEQTRGWRDELEKRSYWAVGESATVLHMAVTGENHVDLVLRQGSYGMVTGDEDDLRAWYKAALATTDLSEVPRAKRVDPKRAAAEAKALARIAKALGPRAKLLAAKSARHDPKLAGDSAKLKALLARHHYPAYPSVLAFERAFGGLVFPEDGGGGDDDWFENGESNLVGPYGCLKSNAHERPDGGRPALRLVPVAYTMNDNIVFIDKAGAFYAQDTIADATATKLRGTAAANVAKLLERFG